MIEIATRSHGNGGRHYPIVSIICYFGDAKTKTYVADIRRGDSQTFVKTQGGFCHVAQKECIHGKRSCSLIVT